MIIRNSDRDIDNHEIIEFDIKRFLKFVKRNKYIIIILYLLTFIPSIFIPYKFVQERKISMGEVNIFLLQKNNSFGGNTYNFLLDKINKVDPYEEIEFVRNKSNLLKIYKEIFPNRKFKDLNFFDNPLIRLKQDNHRDFYINIQFKDKDINKIDRFTNSLIKYYKYKSEEKRAKKFQDFIKRLKNIKGVNISQNKDFDSQRVDNPIQIVELAISTLPQKSWYRIHKVINERKVNQLRIFLVFNFISIFFILIFTLFKERFLGPYNSTEIIEQFLKINFLGDLSLFKDDSYYDEALQLSNLKTSKRLFSNDLIFITFGKNDIKELEKLRTKILINSNANISISNNIYDYKKTDKIILLKNKKAIDLKDLQQLREKIKYIEIEILGWFIIN